MTPRIAKYAPRGRPRGTSHLYSEYLRSMVLLARKHDVDPYQLVDAFVDAWENKIAHCGRLKISCRRVNQESAMFLVEKGEKAVWQFPVSLESIRNLNVLKKRIPDIPIFHREKQMRYQTKQHIAHLKYGMKRVDVTGTIMEIPPPTRIITRWGSEAYVSNAKIADNTGSIRFTLWNDYINKVHVGDEVEIKNCYVSRFAGQSQLRLRRKGTLSIINHLHPEELI